MKRCAMLFAAGALALAPAAPAAARRSTAADTEPRVPIRQLIAPPTNSMRSYPTSHDPATDTLTVG